MSNSNYSKIAIRYGNYSNRTPMIQDALKEMGVQYYNLEKDYRGAPLVHEIDPSTGEQLRRIWVSISHSYLKFGAILSTKAIIAVSLGNPVGIDMERSDRKISIRPNRILSKKESIVYQQIKKDTEVGEAALNECILTFWTIKEAILKARATGINGPLNKCCSIKAIEKNMIQTFRYREFIISICFLPHQ
jgi:phosphopantetheinyl transferase (holo-ACP synthase)